MLLVGALINIGSPAAVLSCLPALLLEGFVAGHFLKMVRDNTEETRQKFARACQFVTYIFIFLLGVASILYILVFLILLFGGDAGGAFLLLLFAVIQVSFCLLIITHLNKVVRTYALEKRD